MRERACVLCEWNCVVFCALTGVLVTYNYCHNALNCLYVRAIGICLH